MDQIYIHIIEVAFMLIGLAGCFLPMLPGIPIVYAALVLQHFTDKPYPLWAILSLGALTIIILLAQYILPSITTRKVGASKWASRGAMIGLLFGIFTSFLGPWGILIGPFAGATLGELLFTNKGISKSLKAGAAAFVGVIGSSVVEFFFSITLIIVFIIQQF